MAGIEEAGPEEGVIRVGFRSRSRTFVAMKMSAWASAAPLMPLNASDSACLRAASGLAPRAPPGAPIAAPGRHGDDNGNRQ